eukprot:COSAG01_NODE_601_length_14954_cov_175.954359_24_plen_60_part_01
MKGVERGSCRVGNPLLPGGEGGGGGGGGGVWGGGVGGGGGSFMIVVLPLCFFGFCWGSFF